MKTDKLVPSSPFPAVLAANLDGETHDISRPVDGMTWQMLVVYRGTHCPMCTKYLDKLEGYISRLAELGVGVAAVSADNREQLEDHLGRLSISFPIYYGLDMETMQALGLYISNPRSEKETDHRFPEPGLFVINEQGELHVVDISNNPFVRPDIEVLVSGLEFIKNPDNNYPIRGTYADN